MKVMRTYRAPGLWTGPHGRAEEMWAGVGLGWLASWCPSRFCSSIFMRGGEKSQSGPRGLCKLSQGGPVPVLYCTFIPRDEQWWQVCHFVCQPTTFMGPPRGCCKVTASVGSPLSFYSFQGASLTLKHNLCIHKRLSLAAQFLTTFSHKADSAVAVTQVFQIFFFFLWFFLLLTPLKEKTNKHASVKCVMINVGWLT